jgi:hypothetical protein
MGNRNSFLKPNNRTDDLNADGPAANEQNSTDRTSSSSSSSSNDTRTLDPNVPNRRFPLIDAQVGLFTFVRNSRFFSSFVNAMIAVHMWGRKINNAAQKVKDMFNIIIDSFKDIEAKALCEAMVEWARQKSKEVAQWMRKDSKTTTLIVMVVLTIMFGAAAPAILGSIGFSAVGPVAGMYLSANCLVSMSLHIIGTIAASWQASIGSVATGSLFTILQSAAMGGFGVAIVSLVGAGISFVGLAGLWRR